MAANCFDRRAVDDLAFVDDGRRTALQGKTFFLRYPRKDADEENDLPLVDFSERHSDPRDGYEAFQPWVFVTIGEEEEEEPLNLYARAVVQQFLQTSGTQVVEPSEQSVDLLKRLMVRYLVQQFKYRSFRPRQCQRPIPLLPGELRCVAAAKARHVERLAGFDIP
jgi:hypothetical protein